MKNKKGNVGNAITLIIGVAVSVLVLIFVGSLAGQTFNLVESDIDAIGVTTITGDTFTAQTKVLKDLDHTNIYATTFKLTNGTNALVVHSSNYTLFAALGKINVTDAKWNNKVLTANYQYEDGTVEGHVKGGIISGFNALEQTGNYLPIIVLAVIITIVLGLVLGMGGMVNNGNRNTPL
jgi:hypothetical protein